MVQTVYVAMSGTYHEGAYVLGVASTAEKAQAICEKDHQGDDAVGRLQWKGMSADHSAYESQYYEVKAQVVDGAEYDREHFAS